MKHKGQIVERAVRKSGYSLTKLAKSLGISRNTLYNRFDNPNLGYRFIIDVGNIIHYDFTLDFPEIRNEAEMLGESSVRSIDRGAAELLRVEGKYIRLLEKYTKLLGILVRLSNENELPALKREITEFIEREEGV
ncbi:MAG: helix-turn-helix domain-containing protein [Burkholderiales bacterium]